MLQQVILWLEKHQVACYYKTHLGISCPGCGFQTAFILLLKGKIWQSVVMYPALIPILMFFTFIFFSMFFKIKNQFRLVKIQFIIIIALILTGYLSKIL